MTSAHWKHVSDVVACRLQLRKGTAACFLLAGGVLSLSLLLSPELFAQVVQGGVVVEAPGGRVQAVPSSRPPAGSPAPQPNSGPATNADQKKPEGTPTGDAKKSEASSSPINRSDYTPEPYVEPIPVKPDADGRVKFNFHGAPWPVVLDWLARYAQLNLDWQELPGDYLNLRTQQTYSAVDARDIINRHLLMRGYTLLLHDELLTVAKVQGLNPGLVPRVSPAELIACKPHEYVKVSLPLEWILAEEAVEQLKPMLSPHGELHAIAAVNRLEAMDVAVNLLEIYQLLSDEQQGAKSERGLVREFKLRHVRAVDVVDSLYGILGIRKPQNLGNASNDISSNMSAQIMQQLQQMQQNMQRQNQPQPGKTGGGKQPEEPKLVLNERENSILVHAAPDKMEIIEQTIKAIDVPTQKQAHILQSLDRMRVYRLSTLKPDPLVKILTEIGDLSPTTKIQVDSANNSIIVFGSLADHVTVQSLVDRLDGSSRSFEVIPLRRLRARDVAGTIQFMIGEEEKQEDNSNSRYFGYYYGGRSTQETKKEERRFRVDADIENNRLLVWANEIELKEIQNLLLKMGEFPSGQGNPARQRTIDLYSEEEAQRLLDRLQRVWEQTQPNELQVAPERSSPGGSSAQESQRPGEPDLSTDREEPPGRKEVRFDQPTFSSSDSGAGSPALLSRERSLISNTQLTRRRDETTPEHPLALQPIPQEIERDTTPHALSQTVQGGFSERAGAAPVTVRQLPNGRLWIESDDPRALDELELLIDDLRPPAAEYKIYHIKHAWPFGIELNLTSFFDSREDEEQVLDWWGNTRKVNKEQPDRLSKKRKLKIISDDDSRTLLVQGATPQQLAIIEDLLKVYDKPESSDPKAVRETRVFHLKYSDAAVISDAVKSVYRDLLSANDPALQSKSKEGQQPQQANQGISFSPFRQQNDKDDKDQPREPMKFKGLLSIGIDDVSNTMIVSAASGLMRDIEQLVDILDQAAKPELDVRVVPVHPALGASYLRDRLNQSFGFNGGVNVSSTKERRAQRERQQDDAHHNTPMPGNFPNDQ